MAAAIPITATLFSMEIQVLLPGALEGEGNEGKQKGDGGKGEVESEEGERNARTKESIWNIGRLCNVTRRNSVEAPHRSLPFSWGLGPYSLCPATIFPISLP